LRRRLERALDASREDPEAHVVVCGGAVFGPNESEVMAAWLRARGVRRVLLESQSRSTRENARFAAPIIAELVPARVTLVTERFHLERSRVLLAEALAALRVGCEVEGLAAEDDLGMAGRLLRAGHERVKLWLDRRR
jgi:hypothetical protein